MPEWSLPRSPASALLLTRFGVEHGLPEAVCLRGTGLPREALADPHGEVTADQELRIVRNLLRALPGVAAPGLRAGARYHLTTHGIWGFALVSSSTLWEAITVGLRHLNLTFAFCHVRLEADDAGARLVLDGSRIPSDARRFLVERELATIVTLGRELCSVPSEALTVRFAFPEPRDAGVYQEVLGLRPEFAAAENSVRLVRDLLDRPLPLADPHAAALAEEQCRELLRRWRDRAGLAGQVRDRLTARPQAMPGIDEVAAGLHLSTRTLRRRLTEEGTSFRALAEEVRRGLAEELLGRSGLTVAEIAHRLGYTASPAFTHAFTRWTGHSPRAYRRNGISGGAG
jgi:AraC-like DNA-binding protein